MAKKNFVLGIDLGTSGVRIAILNNEYSLEYFSSNEYQEGLKNCYNWKDCCIDLITKIPLRIKKELVACSIDGTSGTLMASDYEGNPMGNALPYFEKCLTKERNNSFFFKSQQEIYMKHSSIARASNLINKYGINILLRHQADWISGWLLNNWTYGEEGNNIKLGWDLIQKSWPSQLIETPWSNALPKIVPSGSFLGFIAPNKAEELVLPRLSLIHI